jgi:hypothetical protein
MSWSIQGEYMENCSCDVLCPCTIHPTGSNLPIARSVRGRFEDFGLSFDNTGKNGHYREFAWQG